MKDNNANGEDKKIGDVNNRSGASDENLRSFDIETKLCSGAACPSSPRFVKTMAGRELTVEYFQREGGFNCPVHVTDKADLDLKMPTTSSSYNTKQFGIQDIRSAVGSRRCVDVIDCRTRKNLNLTMKDWHRYFEEEEEKRSSLLQVVRLEFSNTKLDSLVTRPRIVRQLDWIDKAWPRHLKDMQTETTITTSSPSSSAAAAANSLEDMMYPKVQKYCLMSVKKCYTDFHIDIGGSSVW